jgi:molybdenum cofactor biosynthesis enzyme MoaA
MDNNKLSRIKTKPIVGPVFGDLDDPYGPKPSQPVILSIFPVSGEPDYLVHQALEADLSSVRKLRFEPVNVCNISCVFCPHYTRGPMAQIDPLLFEKLIKKIAGHCKRILFGCLYEPLMSRHFVDYAEVLRRYFSGQADDGGIVSMATNGLLLHRIDMAALAPVLSWLHISVVSNIPETYEKLQRGARFEQLCNNVKMIREGFPGLRMHCEMVVSQFNLHQVEDYVQWAFYEMGFNSVNLRRIEFDLKMSPQSPLRSLTEQKDTVSLSDSEWSMMVEKVMKKFCARLSAVYLGDSLDPTPVLELSRD